MERLVTTEPLLFEVEQVQLQVDRENPALRLPVAVLQVERLQVDRV